MAKTTIERLKELTIANKNNNADFPYIHLDAENKYRGWVMDLGLTYVPTGEKLALDLRNEKDLFLLFVLASSWSKSGHWENAVFFTAYLKTEYPDILEKSFELKTQERPFILKNYVGITLRKNIRRFRKDFPNSVNVLLCIWDDIKNKLHESDKSNNWMAFIEYIRSDAARGLGAGTNKMHKKIPLILRELRCQNIYSTIPGELCCVADTRVRDAYTELGEKLPVDYLAASKALYDHFGDMYDIPAFAYEDFTNHGML